MNDKIEMNKADRDRLRTLAARQKEISDLPLMHERRERGAALFNGVSGIRPIFGLGSGTFDRDFMPPEMLHCRSPFARGFEMQFLRNIRHHEVLGDDNIIPETVNVGWVTVIDLYGIEIPRITRKDAEGVVTGYNFEHPIKDLDEDGFDMIKPSCLSVDREATEARRSCLEECIGDIVPVKIAPGGVDNRITHRLMQLMSMESLFLAMYDCPDKLHGLLSLLRDKAKEWALWLEKEELIGTDEAGKPKQLSDLDAHMDSQETTGIDPGQFQEFFFPYYQDLASLYGRIYYGCCEPLNEFWDSVSKIQNLYAVSISPWADEEFMAEKLHGKGIVYVRKPNPNLLGVDVELDEEAWRAAIATTLKVTQKYNVPVAFSVGDVYTLHGNLGKAKRAVDIANEEIDKVYGPLES